MELKQDGINRVLCTKMLSWKCLFASSKKLTAHMGRPSKHRLKWNYINISVYSKYKHDNTLLQPLLLIPNTHHSCFALSLPPSLGFSPFLSCSGTKVAFMVTHWNKEWGDGGGQRWQECVHRARLWRQKHHFVKLRRRPSLTLTAFEKSRVLVSPRPAPDSTDPQHPPNSPPEPTFSCP